MTVTKVPDFKSLHEIEMPVRWGDLDAYGHMNNTVFLRCFEEARVRFFNGMDFYVDGVNDGPILLSANVNFLREVNYPNTLKIESGVGEIGRTSFSIFHRMIGEDGLLYAEGSTRIVWINFREKKSIPVPDKIKALVSSE